MYNYYVNYTFEVSLLDVASISSVFLFFYFWLLRINSLAKEHEKNKAELSVDYITFQVLCKLKFLNCSLSVAGLLACQRKHLPLFFAKEWLQQGIDCLSM